MKKIKKVLVKLRIFFEKLISKIQFKYFLPYFLLASIAIFMAVSSYYYVIPMYHGYLREQREIKSLKNKIRIDYEKVSIFKIIASFNSGLSGVKEKKVANLIFNMGERYKINPALILAVIRVESSFNNFSYSDKGAVGLMQIRPVTGLYLIKKYGIKSKKFNYNVKYMEYLPVNYLYNPSLNIKIGVRYLLSLLYEFKNLKFALFAYNAGPTLAHRTLNSAGKSARLSYSESTNRLFSDFYYGYYKRVKKYFAIYNKDIFTGNPATIGNAYSE